MIRGVLAAMAVLVFGAGAGLACGAKGAPCRVDLGEYYIATPDGPGPHPAMMFLHGYGGNGAQALSFSKSMLARGFAVIGPHGKPTDDNSTNWNFRPVVPGARDELAFFRQVLEDAAEQHGIDTDRILLTGFSVGGSMASDTACLAPDIARAYAPLAGSFWRPHPELEGCAGPVDLFHTHGWNDMTVPIEGRRVGGGYVQGDVFYAMQVWRTVNGCSAHKPDWVEIGEMYWRRGWTNCKAGSLQFALHSGRHGIPNGWLNMVVNWFEGLPSRR